MKPRNIKLRAEILAGMLVLAFLSGMLASNPSAEPSHTGFASLPAPGTEYATVTKVIDGDTVVANGEHIRLLGIDADERGYPCYNAAKKRLEELVLNKNVTLEKGEKDKGYYGRYLRYRFVDGINVNLQLVKEGLAVARFFSGNDRHKQEILAAEKDAMANHRGCKWKDLE